MNMTNRLVEVGASESTGATGKTGMVEDILDLNRHPIENGSYLDELSRHVEMSEKYKVTFLGSLMRYMSEKRRPKNHSNRSKFNFSSPNLSLADKSRIF